MNGLARFVRGEVMRVRIFVLALILILSTCSLALSCIVCEADDPDTYDEANAGSARAQYVLAWKYATGHNTDKDDKESFRWLKKAADNGYEHAILRLGEYYMKGRGVKADVPRAIALLEKAASLFKGGEAAGLLADIYGNKSYNNLNRVLAYKWLSISEKKDKKAGLGKLERSMSSEDIAAAKRDAADWIEKNKNNPPPKSYDYLP